MAIKKIAIVFRPVRSHLKQLEVWLKNESESSGEGFYCNWRVINRAFNEKNLFCAAVNHEVVGFLVWWQSGVEGGIDILEVHPQYRGKGIGRSLVEATLNKLSSEGVSRVRLECVPPTSEPFWRHLGFEDNPAIDLRSHSSSVKLYRQMP